MKTLLMKNRIALVAAVACAALQTVPSHATVTTVAWYRLGEGDPGAAVGATATNTIDSAGAKNLTFQGNAHYANDVTPIAAGHAGSSLSINFTSGAYATRSVVSTATDNFGVECWVKPTALGGGQVIVYNGATGGLNSGGWGIIIAADNTYQGLFGGLTAFGTNVAMANVWTHLALVCSGGISTLYVNGVPSGGSSSGMYTPQGNFALGAPPQSPTSQFFTGLMDEVRVFTFAPGQFSTSDLLLKVWTPRLTVNGNNPMFLKHQTWGDPGVTVHAIPRGVSAGSFHSLVAKADGTVAAFGDNAFGQRNIASIANNAVAVAAGYYHSLALNADGTVLGRGYNLYGQINIPASAVNVVAIAAGQYHSLALRADGTVVGWGDNSHGELNVPASATNVIAISAGDGHSLAVKANGTVLAWGYNGYGEITVPARATNVVAVAAGDSFSLALKRDGTVVGWGYNGHGEINIPASATNVVAIAAGEEHSLALKADSTVIGWGNNFYGQASGPGSATNVVAIAGGRNHSLAVKADGAVLGWGYNGYGQISVPGGLDLVNLPVTSIDNVNTNVPGKYQVNYSVTNSY